MNKVKVLIEGYAKELRDGWLASSTTTLIEANGKLIISDPGCNREKLLKSLEKEKTETRDIDFVFLTHGHIDHTILAGIFENAKIVDELYVYDKDLIVAHDGIIPGTDLKVIRTPGQKEEHCSLMVKTDNGVYAIAGDTFWWLDCEKQVVDINKPDGDPEHTNFRNLLTSRKKLLELADYIIPGHGKMFKVQK